MKKNSTNSSHLWSSEGESKIHSESNSRQKQSRLTENLIIGSGKMAKHFTHYLSLLGVPFDQASRKTNSIEEITVKIAKAQRIFLALSDSALGDFLAKNYVADKTWIHFSGALSLPGTYACHPLMSFSEVMYSLDEYKKIHFVICNNTTSDLGFHELLPFLPNTFSTLSEQQKEKYHAYCVMAGNFPIILWTQVAKQFTEWEIPQEAFNSYLQNNLNNFKTLKEKSLTGPLQRRDLLTIKKNINSLEQEPTLQAIYKAFVDCKGIKI